MPVRSTVLRISLLALLVALVASTPLVHGKPTESSQGAVDSLSRRVDELSTRQKMWEEVQDRSRSEWIAVQKVIQAAHQESAKQNQSAAVKEVKDLIAEFKDGYDSKIEMVDKWVNATKTSMDHFVSFLAFLAALAGIGGLTGYVKLGLWIRVRAQEELNSLIQEAEKKIEQISQYEAHAEVTCSSLDAKHAQAERMMENLKIGRAEVEQYEVPVEDANERGTPATEMQTAIKLAISEGRFVDAEVLGRLLLIQRPDDKNVLKIYAYICGQLGLSSEGDSEKYKWTEQAQARFRQLVCAHNESFALEDLAIASYNLAVMEAEHAKKFERIEQAIADMTNALEVSPSVRMYTLLAWLYGMRSVAVCNEEEQRESLNFELDYIRKALEIDQYDDESLYLFAIVYCDKCERSRETNFDDDAVALVEIARKKFEEKYPNDFKTLSVLNSAAYVSSSIEEKVKLYNKAIKIFYRTAMEGRTKDGYEWVICSLLWLRAVLVEQSQKDSTFAKLVAVYNEGRRRYGRFQSYNEACVLALTGKVGDALATLEYCLNSCTLPPHDIILNDDDLASLRDNPVFLSIVERRKQQ